MKSLQSTRRCCLPVCSRCASVFATIAKSCNAPLRIYNRVDFRWMLNGHPLLLSHGWKPESGFLRARWDTYSEDTILYLLAIGSPTYPISPASWYALWRDRYRYEGHSYFTTIGVPLFMHQYSHAWIDYRNRRETKRRPHRLFSKLRCRHARASRVLHEPRARVPRLWTRHLGHHGV